MVIDSSALFAILSDEPERRRFNEAIEAAESSVISVASSLRLRTSSRRVSEQRVFVISIFSLASQGSNS